MAQTFSTKAILLSKKPYQDLHFIFNFLTEKGQKVGAIAYYAKGSKKRFDSFAEIFFNYDLVYEKKPQKDLVILKDLKIDDHYNLNQQNLSCFALNQFFAECGFKLLQPGDDHPEVYQLLRLIKKNLNQNQPDSFYQFLFLFGLYQFLLILGVKPDFSSCASCKQSRLIKKDTVDFYFFGESRLYCSECIVGGRLKNLNFKKIKACDLNGFDFFDSITKDFLPDAQNNMAKIKSLFDSAKTNQVMTESLIQVLVNEFDVQFRSLSFLKDIFFSFHPLSIKN